MTLPNSVFLNFPIEYKKIEPEDFKGFKVKDKVLVEIGKDGYLSESLYNRLSLKQKETIVINAPVGSGKSYAILKLIQRIYKEEPNSVIIVAPPFVSLIEQYCIDINVISEIPTYDVFDYSDLGRNPKVPFLGKRVHVVTANTLLGNPGEDGFKNSEAKREYLREVISECKIKSQKVYFIYDEIHDSISNFKEEFIFNLWNWDNLIHKNILISATYNEASKVVIKYLAELTDKKITIIEAPRKRVQEKLSKLHLHYCSDLNFTIKTSKIVSVVESLLTRDKNIDILCYSKTLAKSIINDKTSIGKSLTEKYGYINDCTSELISNQRGPNEPPRNRYDNSACNVGTNFKSGVNIVKNNHAYVIILPPRATRLTFRNLSGIFSDGIVGIVQAIARQRTKGEIHIILPKPYRFEFSSLAVANMTQIQQETFQLHYKKIQYHSNEVTPVSYLPLTVQQQVLLTFYHEVLKKEVEYSLRKCESKGNSGKRVSMPRLTFPPYEIFTLTTGEDYLASSIKFFGEDLSAYVTYCAFTNQFVNCNLVYLNSKNPIYFEVGKIQEGLKSSFLKHFGEDYYESVATYSNFGQFYTSIRGSYFEDYSPILKNTDEVYTVIKPFKNSEFQLQLLKFCLKIYSNTLSLYKLGPTRDEEYTRSEYLLNCISYSMDNPKENALTNAYNFLGILRERLILDITTSKTGIQYLPLIPSDNFIKATEMNKLFTSLEILMNEDPLMKNDVFTFRRNLKKKDSSSQLAAIYKVLLEDLFLTQASKVQISKKRMNVKMVQEVKSLTKVEFSHLMTPNLDVNYTDALTEVILEIKDEQGNPKYETLHQYFDDKSKTFKELK